MASRKPVIHGSDHLPGHADPIPGLTGGEIRYEFANTGAWLDVTTTGADGSGYAMHWVADDEVFWDLDETSSDAVFHVEAYSVLVEALGTAASLTLHSNYDSHLTADRLLSIFGGTDDVASAGIDMEATHGDILIKSNDGEIAILGVDGVQISSPVSVEIASVSSVRLNSPSQQTTPVTLADVIAVLNSYGLTV